MTDSRLHELENRHARHVFDLAEIWYEKSAGGWTPDLVDHVDAEADNIRRGLGRLATVNPRESLVLGFRVEALWLTRGRLAEGFSRFQQTAAMAPEPSNELARATASSLLLAQWLLPADSLRELADEATRMARGVRDRSALVTALSSRTMIASREGDLAVVTGIQAELETLDLTNLDVRARMYLGELQAFAAYAIHGPRSDEYVERLRVQLAESSNAGWIGTMSVAASNLAEALCFRGEYAEAASLADDAVRLFRTQERPVDLGLALSCLAGALAELGRTDEAVAAGSESALIAVSLQLPGNMADALRAGTPVALLTGQPYLAARLWGAVQRLDAETGYDLPPDYRRIGESHLAKASPAAPRIAIELAIREGGAEDPIELLRALPGYLGTASMAPTVIGASATAN